MKLSFQKKGARRPQSLNVGTYEAEVIDVSFDDNYVDGSVLKVKYELTDTNGNKFQYEEKFHTGYRNSRTREFLDYLEENGIDDQSLDAFVGCRERVVIKKNPTFRGTFPTIVEREFTYNQVVEDYDVAQN